MAGDQLVGLYNAFNLNLPITSTTTTYNVDTTTLFDNNNDPFIFDLQTHLLLDQCSAYSTINNNMNLQFDHCSNDNYNFFPPNHDDQFDDHCYYPCSKDWKISCYDCRFESTEMNCAKGYKYCYPGFNYSTSDYSSTLLIHSLIVDNSSENKPIAVTKVDHGLSAQSVKARQRRRRITEKTHELGKLIPGGNKMNTAEMFHSAFKYIKFLQAQVGFLQFMASIDQGIYREYYRTVVMEMKAVRASVIKEEKMSNREFFLQLQLHKRSCTLQRSVWFQNNSMKSLMQKIMRTI